ncbi:MAG: antibiotic biosynthesis monooxygenase [Veillonella sp.]|nr:antibiotic biosynthesis monooxygenase [Veillonella sp.]
MNKRMIKRILLTSAIAILGVSTSFAAFTFDKQEQVDTAPIVGLYRYQVPAELQGAYNTAGVQNLTASMANEPNTLSMNVAHVKGNPSESYVVEVYKDTAALETHRNALSLINDGQSVVTLTDFTVDGNEVDTVQKQYQLDIDRAIRDDAGYKAGYVLRERNNKTHWYVIQIYSDESAFNKHVNSPGYRFMMSQIQGSLQNVTTKVLEGDILVNHGGQVFVRP